MPVYRSDDFAPSAGLPGVAVTELLDGRRGTASLTLGLIDLLPGGLIPAHRHPVEKVFYVLAGTATVVLDGQAFALRPGDFVLVPAGVSHRLVGEGTGCRLLFVYPAPTHPPADWQEPLPPDLRGVGPAAETGA